MRRHTIVEIGNKPGRPPIHGSENAAPHPEDLRVKGKRNAAAAYKWLFRDAYEDRNLHE